MSSGTVEADKSGDKPFSGVVVVFTAVHRKHVGKYYREITALGGKVSDTIDESSSFLVVRRVGSEKYVKARKRGLPCVQVRWLNDCLHQKTLLPPDAYLARPFEGCVITATQLELDEREQLAKVVQQHGGTYSGDLRVDAASGNGPATTHLVALARSGEKYLRASMEKDIRIVSPAWIDACVADGGWVDERHFPVVSKPDAQNAKSALKAATATANAATIPSSGRDGAAKGAAAAAAMQQHPAIRIEDLPPIDDFPPCQVFQGLTFYIHGYEPQICDYVIQLVIKGGGMRYPLLLPGVTTTVFENTPANDSFVRTIKRMPFDITMLTAQELVNWFRHETMDGDAAAILTSESATSSEQMSASLQESSPSSKSTMEAEASGHDEEQRRSQRSTKTIQQADAGIIENLGPGREEEDEQASLGIGTELQMFTALLTSGRPEQQAQPAPMKPRSKLWGASQATKLSGESSTKRRTGLSRKQIEGGLLGQTPPKRTRLHQQLEPEPESQQITFTVDP